MHKVVRVGLLERSRQNEERDLMTRLLYPSVRLPCPVRGMGDFLEDGDTV